MNGVHEPEINELKDILSELYLMYGNTDEIVKLSQLVDKVIKNQQNVIVRLRENEQKLKEVIYSENDVICEIDITNNKLKYIKEDLPYEMSSLREKREEIYTYLVETISKIIVHPNDYEKLKEYFSLNNIMKSILKSNSRKIIDVRVLIENEYKWYACTVLPVVDDLSGNVILIIYAKDIHLEKLKEIEIRDKAELDKLTGLYNKAVAVNKVLEIIKNEKNRRYYLIVIDIDNFSKVNSRFGYDFGDAVLQNVAHSIRKVFNCNNNILSRLGSEEFSVFLSEDISKIDVENKICKLQQLISQKYGRDENSIILSASIGVSEHPKDGVLLKYLYEKAWIALYRSKIEGGGKIYFYDNSFGDKFNKVIKNDVVERKYTQSYETIFEQIFKILYETIDLYSAIDLILKIVGERFNICRIYIFENSDDNKFCTNTFEWCNEGMYSVKDKFQNISYDKLGGMRKKIERFDEDGILFCTDISTLDEYPRKSLEKEGIKSILQCLYMMEAKKRDLWDLTQELKIECG